MSSHSNEKTTFSILVWLSAFMAAACGLLIFYAFYIELPYLAYQNRPFPPTVSHIVAGNPIPLTVERCSSSDAEKSYTTTHALRNETSGLTTLLPDVRVSIKPGCHRTTSKINVSPDGLSPGTYTVYGVAIIEGSFRKFNIPWNSEPFEIIEKAK